MSINTDTDILVSGWRHHAACQILRTPGHCTCPLGYPAKAVTAGGVMVPRPTPPAPVPTKVPVQVLVAVVPRPAPLRLLVMSLACAAMTLAGVFITAYAAAAEPWPVALVSLVATTVGATAAVASGITYAIKHREYQLIMDQIRRGHLGLITTA